MSDAFRAAMAGLAAGVVVVSARVPGGFRGLTASTLTSVSLEPPMILVCLDHLAQTTEALAREGRFGVSLLERSQEFIAERFAGRAPLVDPAWSEVPHDLSGHGLPLVRGCLAWLECSLAAVHRAGDHDILVAAVEAAGRGSGEPLVLWDRAFWRLA